MMRNSFKFLVALLGLALWAMPAGHIRTAAAGAAAASGPVGGQIAGARNFVDTMAKKTVLLLHDGSLSDGQKRSRYRSILFADFDLDAIGRFVLGTYWQTATPAQRNEYLKLFREMIVATWADRFQDYKGEKFELRSAHKAEKAGDTLVSSVIIPSDKPEINVNWRVRLKDGHYKVVDVAVEGVSLTIMQRSDFSSVIQSGGNVDALLAELRHRVR